MRSRTGLFLAAIALASACTTTSRGKRYGNTATDTPVASATPTDSATPNLTPASPAPWRTPAGSYVVVAGGNQGFTTSLNDVAVAPINTNGSIGSWSASANTMPTPIGNSQPITSAQWAVNTGGSAPHFLYGSPAEPSGTSFAFYGIVGDAPVTGGFVGAWTMATATTAPISHWMGAVTDGSFVYTIESTSGWGQAVVGALSGGAVASWTGQSAIGIDLDNAAVAEASGHLYTMGGRDSGTTIISTIYRAAVTSPGIVGAWSQAGSLPNTWRRGPHQAVGVPMPGQNYLYVVGGDYSSGVSSDCYVAAVDALGSLGSWQSVTPLPSPIDYGDLVCYRTSGGTYLAAIAGRSGSTDSSSVYYAPINSNGSLGSWQSGPALPSARNMAAAVVF